MPSQRERVLQMLKDAGPRGIRSDASSEREGKYTRWTLTNVGSSTESRDQAGNSRPQPVDATFGVASGVEASSPSPPASEARARALKPAVRPGDYQEQDAGFESKCWIWLGTRDRYGYGFRWVRKRKEKAHRVYYEHFSGLIPEGMEIDHLCRNRACVNPAHLEVVTHKVNSRRSSWAKLDPEKAAEIRDSSDPSAVIAKRFGISKRTVSDVRSGRTWLDSDSKSSPGSLFDLPPAPNAFDPWERAA